MRQGRSPISYGGKLSPLWGLSGFRPFMNHDDMIHSMITLNLGALSSPCKTEHIHGVNGAPISHAFLISATSDWELNPTLHL